MPAPRPDDFKVHQEQRLKRLVYQCGHRGMKELDFLLGRFARQSLATLHAGEVEALEKILEEPEARLLDWLTGREAPPAAYAALIKKIALPPPGQ